MIASRNRVPDILDTVVIGAGAVGLAVARALARSGREVFVLERHPQPGTGASSRSSEVIHAGLYYPAQSNKARFCCRGQKLLYDYLATKGVPHRRIGKLIVAHDEQQYTRLQTIEANALACGVTSLRLLERPQVMEPKLVATAALWSPDTGIFDSHAYIQALVGDLTQAGGHLVCNTQVQELRSDLTLTLLGGGQWRCRCLVNAAGPGAGPLLGGMPGFPKSCLFRNYYAKGHYFRLAAKVPFRHLIYPLPDSHGLGIHLTINLAGQARFGPDVHWQNDSSDHSFEARAGDFAAAIQRYYPSLDEGMLQADYTGVRTRIAGPQGPPGDFVIQGPQQHAIDGLVNLLGIESPGLTASLAIGEEVARILA